MRRIKFCFALAAIFLCSFLLRPQPVAAAVPQNVLLVYDSQNVGDGRQNNVAAMQRLLTSAGAAVHVESITNYQTGTLWRGDYTGLVTMINWNDVPIRKHTFTAEQRDFTGPQLHVGGNLSGPELTRLHAQKQTLYRRQLQASLPHVQRQLLPFVTDVDVLSKLPAAAQIYGQLRVQGVSNLAYPFAYRYGAAGFLPFFDGQGISLLAAEHLVASLFGTAARQTQPLLTITGVTPYSDLGLLKRTAAFLRARGINFAVSAATVFANTELPELGRYAAALRTVQADGGVIFVRTPEVGAPGAKSGPLLNANMTTAITALSQKHVYPIGYSVPTYLQRDTVFKKYALSGASTVLQLGDPKLRASAKSSRDTQTYRRAYTTVSAASMNRNKYGRPLSAQNQDFALPTAVTFKMPASAKGLHGFKQQVRDFNFDWADSNGLNTRLTVATLVLTHRDGQYFMNGRQQDGHYAPVAKPRASASLPSKINDFFAIQSTFLWVFFFITITAMVVLLVIGRRVYLRMYRRQ